MWAGVAFWVGKVIDAPDREGRGHFRVRRRAGLLQLATGTVGLVVRLIPVETNGKIVWVEDAPTHCPHGHEGVLPRWEPCVRCGWACRHWRCRDIGCGAPLIRDPEHVCRG